MSREDAGGRDGSVRHRLPYSRAFRVALSLGSGQIFTRNARLRYSQTYDQRQPLTSGHVDNQTSNHPQSSSEPHPQSSSQPHPQSSSYPYPQSSSQPHPQSSSQPHPHSSSQPHPQSSSQPHPQSSSQPHPQSSSQPHPQSSSQPHRQSSSHPQSSSQPHPQSSSHPHPLFSSQPHPLFSSHPHPLFSSQPHPLFSNYPHPRFSSHPHHQSSNQPHPQTLNQLHPQTSRRRRLRSSNQQRPQTFIQRRIRFSGQQDPQTSLEAFSVVDNMHRTAAFRTYRTTVEESESYSDTSVDSSDYISSDGSSDDSSDGSSDDSSGDSTDDDVVMEMTVKKSQICPPVSARNESFQPELCAKDAVGECHDPACPLSHFQVCDFCKKPKLHPTNNSERSQHLKDCLFEQSKDKTCEVCLETILQPQSENRFGLQQNCKHCVCFDCLRRWNQNKKMANHKACPTCRTDSGCILSSRYWIEPVEVKGPVMQYVKELLENTVKPNSTVYEIIELIC